MLPRLLYLGDVPVEASFHGSILLYRLLQGYPADRLQIIEGDLFPAATDRRLAGVTHLPLRVGHRRLLNSRLHHSYSRWLLLRAASRVNQLPALVGSFDPQVVLTVGHGYSWVTAARFATARRLPLVFVIHDDWPRAVAAQLRPSVERAFAGVYRQASARLCASPFMTEDYERRYGVPGTVLLPYRGAAVSPRSGTDEPSPVPDRPPVFAFAGTINSPGYGNLLRRLAESAARHQGRLIIFGPVTESQGTRFGLALPNVTFAGLLPPADLLARMRRDADILFAPMSFDEIERANMRMGFPSKLPDYTATGLPLFICGPPDCSAVRWARENDGVAEVATADDQASMDAAVDRLVQDAGYRKKLAAEARRVGDRDFSVAAAQAILHRALAAARAP